MLALEAILDYERGNVCVLKNEKWLKCLVMTKERRMNVERVEAMKDLGSNLVLSYVKRTLEVLERSYLSPHEHYIVESVLKWSEVAKCGTSYHRKTWIDNRINLYVHNEGSADIYLNHVKQPISSDDYMIHTLINTHGLIGQYLRGEVALSWNSPLYALLQKNTIDVYTLTNILRVLNECIISGVSEQLWLSVKNSVYSTIDRLLSGDLTEDTNLISRVSQLRSRSITNGEDLNRELHSLNATEGAKSLNHSLEVLGTLFREKSLWYVESALHNFSMEEFFKILVLVSVSAKAQGATHISFEHMMHQVYYDHNGKKKINIYMKRIIEQYLKSMSLSDILEGATHANPHVVHTITMAEGTSDVLFFNFEFSPAGSKLIEFCVEAEKAGLEYEKAPLMLFDVFGLRRDKYDRFHNEESYLETMNSSVDFKRVVLDHISGNTVLDIGPGGGIMLDLIEDEMPDKHVVGIDISSNVVEALNRKKFKENRSWNVIQGDALNLRNSFEQGSVDTIIFSSILHEIFSYCEFEGRLFNTDIIPEALKSAYDILPIGGRIVIRDGIMSEPDDAKRIIKFSSDEGLKFVERYAQDFQGRRIQYVVTGHNEVMMPINDAMECLYTYTWGEEAYVHEVQEQFGYFTPSQYVECITNTFGDSADILSVRHFLQDGYTQALSPKITIMDENRQEVSLPDSTCLIVIEKKKGVSD